MARGDRPNYATRKRYRMALTGLPCMSCGLPVDWDTTGKPDSATFGHIVADIIGGRFTPANIGVQCWTCNDYCGKVKAYDLTHYVPYYVAYDLPSQADADEWYSTLTNETDKARRTSIIASLLSE